MVGALVVGELAGRGDEVRVLSRRPGGDLPAGASHRRVDLSTGDGLSAGVEEVDAVVDAANEMRRAEAVLVGGTRRLLEAEAGAGVGHHLAISIVGCERTPYSYYRVKVAQEREVASGPVPWSVLRATQFHTLLAGVFAMAARGRLLPTGRIRLQPIDPAVVAHRIAEAVHAGPSGHLPDIAGPEVRTLTELARAWRGHDGRSLLPIRAPIVGRLGRALRAGTLCDPAAAAGGPTFERWLAGERFFGSEGRSGS